MTTEISTLYWAPKAEQFVCVSPDFPAKDYGFVRHPVQHSRWYSGDVFHALRAYQEGKFKNVTDAAQARLLPYTTAYEQSYATLPPVLGCPEIPVPTGQIAKEYQKAGVHAMWTLMQGATMKARKGALLADEMGLGKTIQTILLANTLRARRVLVICPASLRINWAREIRDWAVHYTDVHHVFSANFYNPASWVIVSFDMARRKDIFQRLMTDVFDMVVIDEAHYVKSCTSKRTQAVVGSRKGVNIRHGLISRAPRTVFLTGTPVPNRPPEAWNYVWPFALQNFPITSKNQWDRCYGSWVQTPFGLKYDRAKNVEDLNTRLRGGYMVRRLKSQVLSELPPKQHKMVVFPSSGGEIKEILREEKQFNVEEVLRHAVPRGSAVSTLRRKMGLAKLPLVIDYITNLLEEADKIVVFAHHTEVVDGLMDALSGFGAVKVTGSCTLQHRQNSVDIFQTDPACRIFVGNIEAAGVGWTLHAAHNVVFAEHSWVPGHNIQAADRCHRIGQKGHVMVHDLVVEGSLDGKILLAGAKKAKEIEEMLT